MKVFFTTREGATVEKVIDLDVLAHHGILHFQDRYFVFAHFVHGEDAVQYDECFVAEVAE